MMKILYVTHMIMALAKMPILLPMGNNRDSLIRKGMAGVKFSAIFSLSDKVSPSDL